MASLLARIESALKKVTEGRALMSIPPRDDDVDMVLVDCRRAIESEVRALAGGGVTGWVTVPEKPTPEMLRHMVEMQEGQAAYKCISSKGIARLEADMADIYGAAILAGPSTSNGLTPGESMNTESVSLEGVLSPECEKALLTEDLYSSPNIISADWADIHDDEGTRVFTVTRAIALIDLRALFTCRKREFRAGQAAGKEALSASLRELLGAAPERLT